MTKILKEEGGDLFDSRSASLGHTLQGGVPSPLDRARAVRLSLKCMLFIERQAREARRNPKALQAAGHESAAVITIQKSSIVFAQVQDVCKHADMKNRRGKNQWWEGFKILAETLGGRTAIVADEDSD
jgi:6-phosphofructokinase 1